jgi:hypothetical protein
VTLRRFELIDRNKYAYPNTTVNFNGYTNLRYRIFGNQLWFIPIPASGQLIQLFYAPEPTSVQFAPTASFVSGSSTITVSDVSNIAVGMSVYASIGLPNGQTAPFATVQSVNVGANQVTLVGGTPSLTASNVTCLFWSDATTIDGIAGWEEFVVVDAAIKANIKVEHDIEGLIAQKAAMVKRIEAMSEGRDQGQAHHVSDALSVNGFGYDDFGDGFGGAGFGGM